MIPFSRSFVSANDSVYVIPTDNGVVLMNVHIPCKICYFKHYTHEMPMEIACKVQSGVWFFWTLALPSLVETMSTCCDPFEVTSNPISKGNPHTITQT